jgi:hypothetical protein
VAAPKLASALVTKRVAAANLRIDLRASPRARMADIEFAVAAPQ